MKPLKPVLFTSAIFLLSAFPLTTLSQANLTEPSRLRIYVGEVKGDADLTRSIRSQLVDELVARRIALVASEEQADAVLTASGVHRTGRRFTTPRKTTVLIVIRGDIELTSRDGKKLWKGDVSSAHWALSETRSFASNAAGQVDQSLRKLSRNRSSLAAAIPSA